MICRCFSVAFIALLLAGCLPDAISPPALMTGVATSPTVIARLSTPQSVQASPERMAEGMQVYRAQYCGVCHQLGVAETTGQFGPSHDQMAQTAQERILHPAYTGSASTPAEYLSESIVAPDVYIVEGYAISSHRMPSYAHLPPGEIEALVYLLAHQR